VSAKLALFALGASRAFGEAVASSLGVTLARHEERWFEDGEHKTRSLENVRGRDACVIHSLYTGAGESVNDKLVRLLFFLGSLRDASAERVTAVVPYLAYARKDQKSKARDPVATRYLAGLFEAVGCDCVVTMDVHNLAAFQNAFRIQTENLEAAGLLAAHFAQRLRGRTEPIAVVSPDAGGIKRAERFRERLGQALGHTPSAAFVEKYRSEGVLTGSELVGEMRGRIAIIVDDLVSAGHTLERAAKACRSAGAVEVFAAATHGVFAGEADAVLSKAPLDGLVATDTIPEARLHDASLRARFTQLATADFFAEAVARLHAGGSISELNSMLR
jgi:ribose-phosphate pyrophosphokinase